MRPPGAELMIVGVTMTMLSCLLIPAAALPHESPPVPRNVSVFEPNLGGVACYRIPSVIQTNKGSLLAFAEARHDSCSDGAVHSIAYRRSTDGGKTWSDVSSAVGNETYWVGNPTSVFTASGKAMLIYVKHKNGCVGDCGFGNAFVVSDDDGQTFGPPQDISEMWGPASGSLPGPGTAAQLKSGRIILPSHHSAYQHDYVSFSDDDGKTWKTINQTFPKMDEAVITQLPSGDVMLNMRHQASKTKGRAVAISRDDGLSFGPITYDKTLISPVCQASLVSFGGKVFFSNPASTVGREKTTVRSSTDGGKAWPHHLLIEAGASAGYSCLVDGALQHPFPGGGDWGGLLYEAPGMTIKFEAFPLTF